MICSYMVYHPFVNIKTNCPIQNVGNKESSNMVYPELIISDFIKLKPMKRANIQNI